MTTHSKKYLNLQNNFKEIKTYVKGMDIDVDRFAGLFYLELVEVNVQYGSLHNLILNKDEFADVQNWINKITGNRNISKTLRRKILEESLEFNEMAETLNASLNSQVDFTR